MMNNDFEIGFLKPDGTLVVCEHYEHTSKAFDICSELNIPCRSSKNNKEPQEKL